MNIKFFETAGITKPSWETKYNVLDILINEQLLIEKFLYYQASNLNGYWTEMFMKKRADARRIIEKALPQIEGGWPEIKKLYKETLG